MNNYLMSHVPAAKFTEAYPIGNGTMGAMIYGGLPLFHMSLNLDTLWSGKPNRKDSLVVSEQIREDVRDYILKGMVYEAQKLVQSQMLSEEYNESYICAADLKLEFVNLKEIKEYTRKLYMDEGYAAIWADTESNHCYIKCAASLMDHSIIIELHTTESVNIKIGMESPLCSDLYVDNNVEELYGEAPEHVEPQYVDCKNPIIYRGGMKYLLQVNVQETDGNCTVEDNRLLIKNSTRTQLIIVGATGFRGFNKPLENRIDVLKQDCKMITDSIRVIKFEDLFIRHQKEYRRLFDRVRFRLGKGQEIYELLFQYGRYLMISSSYAENSYSQPATLQGIWCKEIRPMWSCNLTTNINTEMNYWLTGPCGLPECDGPLIGMIKELAISGAITAKTVFGCNGWTACHNVDLWRQTTPVKGNVKWSFWPMGGIWLSTHLFAHYQYTQDLQFLEQTAYPLMKGAAEFCLDWTKSIDGRLHSLPSTSPENTFLDAEGRECAICDSSTMDIALIREIWLETVEAAEVLNIDEDFVKKIRKGLGQLPEYQIGSMGQLMEWDQDYKEKDPNHRHFAHLVGFHPFHQIDIDQRSEFMGAVRMTLKRRCEGMKQYIGWVEAWLVNFNARLWDGEEAIKHLRRFAGDCVYPNLFSLHPPLGENDSDIEVFQIDGNFGITAGITEMLIQSKKGILIVLPALPKDWKDGKIEGIRMIGGHTIQIEWAQNCLCIGSIEFAGTDMVEIRYRYPFILRKGKWKEMCSKSDRGYYKIRVYGEKGSRVQFYADIQKNITK